MELYISDLIIEVTRKCNMSCEHCLRGAAQRKTINNHHIYKILRLIDQVSTLTVTGGEPTLAMDSLDRIRNELIYNNCDVNSFYMVTNGKSINIEAVAEWVYSMLNVCDDNEMSGVGFSFDPFHVETLNWKQAQKQKRNFYNLQELLLTEYGIDETPCGSSFVSKHSDNSWNYDNLISQGRAENFGTRENTIRTFETDTYNDTIQFTETELYLTCSGWLVAGCNWSYETMDNDKDIQIGHIDDINCTDDLIEALEAHNKRTTKQLQVA